MAKLPALVLLLLLLFTTLSAQEDDRDDVIRQYPGKMQVSLINAYQDYNISAGLQYNSTVSYRNTVVKTGFRVRFSKFGFAASLPVSHINPHKGSLSKNVGFAFNIFPNRMNIRGTARFVEGFEQKNGDEFLFRPDVQLRHFETAATYVFNHRQFSMKAPFRFFERQLVSAGSPMLLATANYKDLHAEDSLFLLADDVLSKVGRMRVLSFGTGAGYGFTFARGNWYLTTVATGGAELNRRRYFDQEDFNLVSDWQLKPVVIGQLSGGYNSDRFFAGLVAFYRPGFGAVENLDASFYRLRTALIAGIRLSQPSFRK